MKPHWGFSKIVYLIDTEIHVAEENSLDNVNCQQGENTSHVESNFSDKTTQAAKSKRMVEGGQNGSC